MERDFKGIWIPKEIWLNENLSLQEKVFLAEVKRLDKGEGCTKTNRYFGEFFGLTSARIKGIIKSLVERNYLTSTIIYKEYSKEVEKRILKIKENDNYKCFVYRLLSLDGKVLYVGKTKNLNKRIKSHLEGTSGSKKDMCYEIYKVQYTTCYSIKDMNNLERYLILKYKNKKQCKYNTKIEKKIDFKYVDNVFEWENYQM